MTTESQSSLKREDVAPSMDMVASDIDACRKFNRMFDSCFGIWSIVQVNKMHPGSRSTSRNIPKTADAKMGLTNVHPLPCRSPARADQATISNAVRQVVGGVTVITFGSSETSAGLTAFSISVLSPEPAMLVLCVDRASANYAVFRRSSRCAVNLLGADQPEIAEHFEGSTTEVGSDSFNVVRWLQLADDPSCLDDFLAVFECEIDEILERDRNAIVIGRVRRALVGDESGALVRWRGFYDQIGWTQIEIMRAVGLRPCNMRTGLQGSR